MTFVQHSTKLKLVMSVFQEKSEVPNDDLRF